jgi:hypothetical protein
MSMDQKLLDFLVADRYSALLGDEAEEWFLICEDSAGVDEYFENGGDCSEEGGGKAAVMSRDIHGDGNFVLRHEDGNELRKERYRPFFRSEYGDRYRDETGERSLWGNWLRDLQGERVA